MVVKIKGSAKQEANRVSRFDFTNEGQTGSIAELIDELNLEYPKKNGELIRFNSLAGVLQFIEQITGQRLYDPYEQMPISVIKLIKLLYVKNDESGRHLFKLLAPPENGGIPTMEFCTGTTISRDTAAANLVDSIIGKLSMEISIDKLDLFYNMLGDEPRQSTSEKFLLALERADDEVTHLLEQRIGDDDLGMANAYSLLAKYIDSIGLRAKLPRTALLNEAIFVHFETLALKHFILHHKDHLKKVVLSHNIGSITDGATNLLNAIVGRARISVLSPFAKYFSVRNFHHIVFGNPSEVAALVKTATGLETRKKRLLENTVRARALLTSYAYRSFDEADPDATTLSLVDIVAALSSFRIQQEIKTDYSPYWHGQKSQGSDPQRLLDKGLKSRDPHQHQGVFQIYYYRFEQFRAAFTGTLPSYHALLAYRLSRLDSLLRIVQTNNIVGIFTSFTGLNNLCMEKAMKIALRYSNSSL